jgi:hypothetical protein
MRPKTPSLPSPLPDALGEALADCYLFLLSRRRARQLDTQQAASDAPATPTGEADAGRTAESQNGGEHG